MRWFKRRRQAQAHAEAGEKQAFSPEHGPGHWFRSAFEWPFETFQARINTLPNGEQELRYTTDSGREVTLTRIDPDRLGQLRDTHEAAIAACIIVRHAWNPPFNIRPDGSYTVDRFTGSGHPPPAEVPSGLQDAFNVIQTKGPEVPEG